MSPCPSATCPALLYQQTTHDPCPEPRQESLHPPQAAGAGLPEKRLAELFPEAIVGVPAHRGHPARLSARLR